ncbi:MAG: YhbY family RNA-binding protein, partial [Legionella longbeachae]|nr:YhbY family RNA-binding protein [Legionella longbeachae]
NGAEKEDRLSMANDLCQRLNAEFLQMIGNIIIMYRKKEEKHK